MSIAPTFAIESLQDFNNYMKMSVDMVCVFTGPMMLYPSASSTGRTGRGVTGIVQQPLVKVAVCAQLVVLSCWHLPVIIARACLVPNWCPNLLFPRLNQISG